MLNQLIRRIRQAINLGYLRRARPRRSLSVATQMLESRQMLSTITNHGGSVMPNVEVRPLYIGSDWGSDPNLKAIAGQLNAFSTDIVSGAYMDQMTNAGFGVGRGTNDSPGTGFRYFNSNIDKSVQLSDSAIQFMLTQIVKEDVAKYGLASVQNNKNLLYTLYIEPGVEVYSGKENSHTDFDAYHSSYIASIPRFPPSPFPDIALIRYSVVVYPGGPNGPPDEDATATHSAEFNQITRASSHEIAEAVTDPDGHTWYDDAKGVNDGEIADIFNDYAAQFDGYTVAVLSTKNLTMLRVPVPTQLSIYEFGGHSDSSSTYGEKRFFTASVTTPNGVVPDGGTVTFTIDNSTTYTANIGSDGDASLNLSNLSVGRHTIKASYGGWGIYSLSNSSSYLSITVNAAPVTTKLSVSSTKITSGQSEQLAATVTSTFVNPDEGSISFYDGSRLLGTSSVHGGSASLTTTALLTGIHSVSATYNPTKNYQQSSSSSISITATPADHKVVVTTTSEFHKDGFLTLLEAIDVANKDTAGDTISFADDVTGTITLNPSMAFPGVYIPISLVISNSMTIVGPGSGSLTIAGGFTRVLKVDDGSSSSTKKVTISGLTFSNGNVLPVVPVLNQDPDLLYGGGILNRENLVLNDVEVKNNVGLYGGGIYNTGTLTATNLYLTTNNASFGGGIKNDGTFISTNGTFSENHGDRGGGVANIGTFRSKDDLFHLNTSSFGGGVANDGNFVSFNDTFWGNTGTMGGGVANHGGFQSTNDTFFDNKAGTGSGGGIFNDTSLTTINDTVTGNTVGGGIDNADGIWNSVNTIVAGNTDGTAAKDVINLSGTSIRNTLIGDPSSSGGIVNGVDGNIVGAIASAIFVTDGTGKPVISYSNGGSTPSIALKPGSLAISSAGSLSPTLAAVTSSANSLTISDANFFPVGSMIRIDSEIMQVTGGTSINNRTVLRAQGGTQAASHSANAKILPAYDQTETVPLSNDLGARAASHQLVVNTLSEFDQAGFLTLIDAVEIANSDSPGDTITFADSLTGTIALNTAGSYLGRIFTISVDVKNSMNIIGPGAGRIAISGGLARILKVDDGNAAVDQKVTISGLTFTNGFEFPGPPPYYTDPDYLFGGALLNRENLVLNNDSFAGNLGIFGGAIYNAGTLTANNSSFQGNFSTTGGAIKNDKILVTNNNTFFNNQGDQGGVITNFGQYTGTGDTFGSNGGSIASGINNAGSATLINQTFALNQGNGIYNTGVLTTINVTVAGSIVGGGVFNVTPTSGSTAVWNSINTIVAGNFNGNAPNDVGNTGGIINARNTLIGDFLTSGGIQNGINGNSGNIIGATVNSIFETDSAGNPVLNNHGNSQSIALAIHSLAISAGSALSVLSLATTTDATTITVKDATFLPVGTFVRIDSEVLQVTGVSGTTLTVLRSQKGTTAATHKLGASIRLAFDQSGVARITDDLGSLAPINHAPIGVGKTITMLEDKSYIFSVADFGFADPDDTPGNALLGVLISVTPSAGRLTLDGADVSYGQFISAADIAAHKLKYTPAKNENGADYSFFIFQVQDGGGTVNGGIDTDPIAKTMTLSVTGVNDAPVGTATTVTTLEDVAYPFHVADFGFTDPGDSSPNSLQSVAISSLPLHGTLTDNSQLVTIGQAIPLVDIVNGNLRFTPVKDANGATYDNFTFRVQDNGGTANGGLDTDLIARKMTVAVTSVNDAPTGTAKTVTILEDATYPFKLTDFTLTDSSDVPANSLQAVKIVSLPTVGSLIKNGVTITQAMVTAGLSVSLAEISAGKLIYFPVRDSNGVNLSSFTFKVQDTGGTANGGIDTDLTARAMTISITAVNDAPVVSSTTTSVTYVENGAAKVINPLLIVTDVDNTALASATVTLTNFVAGQDVLGFVPVAATMGNITGTIANGVVTLKSVGATATTSQWQSALRAVTYQNSSDAPTTTNRIVNFIVNDGLLASKALTSTVVISAVNDAPTLTSTIVSTAYVENGVAKAINPLMVVSDIDNTTLASATVTITNFVTGQDLLGFVPVAATMGNITGTVTNNLLTLTSAGSTATTLQWQNALRAVTYQNLSDNPTTTTRTVRFVVSDGQLASTPFISSVTVTAVNDAPVLSTTISTISYTENGVAKVISPVLVVADVDSTTLASATVTLANFVGGQDVLGFTPVAATMGNITGTITSNVLTLTSAGSTATKLQWQAALRAVTYQNLSDNPTTTTRTVRYVVNDGQLSSTPLVASITILPVNDAPTLTSTTSSVAYIENGVAKVVNPLLVVADVDSTTLASATVTLTNFIAGQDLLGFTPVPATMGNITGSITANVLTLTSAGATATKAQWQAALHAVTYQNTSENPTTTTRTFRFIVNDGQLASSPFISSMTISAVNDAPTLASTTATISYSENGAAKAINPLLTVADVDNTTFASATVTLANFVANQDILGFTPVAATMGNITGTITNGVVKLTSAGATATKLQWQAALRAVTYQNLSDNPSVTARAVTFTINDGQASSSALISTVTITAVNDAPTLASTTNVLTYVENSAAKAINPSLVVADVDNTTLASATVTLTKFVSGEDVLGFNPVLATMGNITATITDGVVTLSSAGATATKLQWQAALRAVTYQNLSDNPTTTTRTVAIVINDGLAASSALTSTIVISAVNDAPVLSSVTNTIPYTINAAAMAINPQITVSDLDNSTLASATVTLATFVSTEDVLGFISNAATMGNITGTIINGVVTLTSVGATASKAQWQAALQAVTYQNSSGSPTLTTRSATFVINDGLVSSNPFVSTITIGP